MDEADYLTHSCAPECAEHPFSSGYDWSAAIRAVTTEYCNVCENFPCLGGHPPAD